MEFRILKYLSLVLLFAACEKEIQVDIPQDPQQIVVEGQIESGSAPIVILTWSQSFFSPVNLEDIANTVIKDADIKMVVNSKDTFQLNTFCTKNLPDSVKKILARQSGLDFISGDADFCLYTTFNPEAIGVPASTYQLLIKVGNSRLSALTKIPAPVALDSIWYKKDAARDTLGFIWSNLSDPAGKYNAYRWFACRISVYKSGPNKGQQKDPVFIAPYSSVFEDEFFDGLNFDFVYNRGSVPGSDKSDDLSIEAGYYKEGDTIAVKFCSIDKDVFTYYRTYYTAIGNTGSPFATPTNIKTNVVGGLGVWAGYGVSIDTLVAIDQRP